MGTPTPRVKRQGMNAEQAEELEVLQSIFPDTFKEVSQNPVTWQLRLDSDMISVNLTVILPEEYPHQVPEIFLDCFRGSFPDMPRLKAELQEEAERSVGLAMVFTLSTLIDQRLSDYVTAHKLAAAKDAPKEKVIGSYNEIRKFDGTPVTVERFHEWNAKFMAELASKRAVEEQKRKAELGNKLTGKQLFEMNKVTAASDTAFYDESGANIDESVFDGLEDLDLGDVDEVQVEEG